MKPTKEQLDAMTEAYITLHGWPDEVHPAVLTKAILDWWQVIAPVAYEQGFDEGHDEGYEVGWQDGAEAEAADRL